MINYYGIYRKDRTLIIQESQNLVGYQLIILNIFFSVLYKLIN